MTYKGKVVFIERNWDEGTEYKYKAPESGQYIVVEDSDLALHLVKPIGGYDGHNLYEAPLRGAHKYRVIASTDNPEFIRSTVKMLEEFAEEKNSPSRQWRESVYNKARRNAQLLKQLLEDPESVLRETVFRVGQQPPSEEIHINADSYEVATQGSSRDLVFYLSGEEVARFRYWTSVSRV